MAKRQAATLNADHAAELTIGEVARQVGLRTSALRYYETVGLLPLPRRVNGRRRFTSEAVRRLNTVRFAQEAGFTIAEIRTLFHGFGADVPPSTRWRQLASRKLTELDALVARADRMRQALHVAMRCGCLRIEDCEFEADESRMLPGPAPRARVPASPRRARLSER